MRREALIEGVSMGEGVALARGHSTKHNTGRRGQIKDRRLRGARRPLPTSHHVKAHRTTLLAILHQPKEGGALHYCKGGSGVLWQPRWMAGDPGAEGVGEEGLCTRRHWGTLTRLWPLGGALGAWAVAFTE